MNFKSTTLIKFSISELLALFHRFLLIFYVEWFTWYATQKIPTATSPYITLFTILMEHIPISINNIYLHTTYLLLPPHHGSVSTSTKSTLYMVFFRFKTSLADNI